MLCRHGQITKNEIGAIKMQGEETFVEIAAGNVDGFVGALGPDMTMERGVRVKRLNGVPDLSGGRDKPARDNKPFGDKKSYGDKKPFGEKKPYAGKRRDDDMVSADREVWGDPKPAGDKQAWKPRGDKPAYAGKSKGKFDDRSNAAPGKKKPYKPKG